ncbi:MAG: hypothetical protein PHG75_06695 [Syntrophomonas sp.]|nr:hypothetical protein [Syntrophomonas sp.]
MNTVCMRFTGKEETKQRMIARIIDRINALASDAQIYFTIVLDSDYEEIYKEAEREGLIF